MKTCYTSLTDGELIQQFIDEKDVAAYDALIRRYYDTLYGRFLVQTENSAEAEDLSQTLWLRVLNYLPNYQDDNKFPHLLHKIATNLLRNRWQDNRKQQDIDANSAQRQNTNEEAENPTEKTVTQQKIIQHLIETLIPQMPTHLRIAFLLKHESEYWDDTQPFLWEHFATLNNVNIETAWQHFQQARDKLINNNHAEKQSDTEQISIDELSTFVLWTQTQRGNKKSKITEHYLATLLNLPVNTFKTHYRRALEFLNKKLNVD